MILTYLKFRRILLKLIFNSSLYFIFLCIADPHGVDCANLESSRLKLIEINSLRNTVIIVLVLVRLPIQHKYLKRQSV